MWNHRVALRFLRLGLTLVALGCSRSGFFYEDAGRRPPAPFAPTPGWHELSGTELMPECPDAVQFPDIQGNSGCACVTCWSGAIADTLRDRLIIWGGGATDYNGNEV